jgi:ribosome recycling factor
MASVSVPEPRTLVIQPWDASVLKTIEKAIQASDLGINPTNDGKSIRLAFPQLNEDRRKELTKLVYKYGEEAKVAVRNVRRDAIEMYKKQQKKSEITEDDLRSTEKEIQDLTDKAVKDIDALASKKEKELMEV